MAECAVQTHKLVTIKGEADMKIGKRTIGMLGIATAVLLATSACSGGLLGGGDTNKGNDSGPIKLGMVVPLSDRKSVV